MFGTGEGNYKLGSHRRTHGIPMRILQVLGNLEMKNPGAFVFLYALLSLSLFQTRAHSTLSGPELDDESEFNYVEGSGKGPEDWWRLNQAWRVCKFGKRQSPINLKDNNVVPDWSLGVLQTKYWKNEATLRNRGHDVMLGWSGDAGTLHIDGVDDAYMLKQCHWHSPAEHEINGWRPDLEMHMVYQTHDNKIAVVGILYVRGMPDPFLAQFEEPLKRLASGGENSVSVGRVTPWNVKGPQPYYRYNGSLTTPPCTEGVVWTVVARVRTVSHEQVELLRAAVNDGMKNNSRPVQPRNGRVVRLFPSLEEHASS